MKTGLRVIYPKKAGISVAKFLKKASFAGAHFDHNKEQQFIYYIHGQSTPTKFKVCDALCVARISSVSK